MGGRFTLLEHVRRGYRQAQVCGHSPKGGQRQKLRRAKRRSAQLCVQPIPSWGRMH
jgi:hypothetical protein